MNIQSIENWLQKVGSGVANEYKKVETLLTDVNKVETVLTKIVPEAKPVVAAILKDIIQAIADGASAAASKGLSFSLDEATYEALLKLIADAKADVPQVKEWLTELGVTF